VTNQYTFLCPNCGEYTVVDEPIRDQLETEGCFMCDTVITDRAFAVQ
jgi:predicted RNA-binding Zn-ribbon protein involved in translation (DUF1610 family)